MSKARRGASTCFSRGSQGKQHGHPWISTFGHWKSIFLLFMVPSLWSPVLVEVHGELGQLSWTWGLGFLVYTAGILQVFLH